MVVVACDKCYDEKYSSISRIESDNEGWDCSFIGSSEMASLIQRHLSKNLKEVRPRVMTIFGKNIPGRRNRQCRGSEAGEARSPIQPSMKPTGAAGERQV